MAFSLSAAAWHAFCAGKGYRYAKDVEACLGGPPAPEREAEYRKRSPLFSLAQARGLPIDIQSGIRDGHGGASVPIDHSLRAFNALAVPASILGGWLWDTVGHMAPFIVMAVIDGLVRMPIVYAYVPEGKTLEQEPDPEEASL